MAYIICSSNAEHGPHLVLESGDTDGPSPHPCLFYRKTSDPTAAETHSVLSYH